jgi:hypothetical protein
MMVSANLIATCIVEAARTQRENPATYPRLSEAVMVKAARALSISTGLSHSIARGLLSGAPAASAPLKGQASRKARSEARITLPTRRDPVAVAAGQASYDALLIEALTKLGAAKMEVEASLRVLSEASGIPHGSVLFVVRRLADDGRIRVNTQQRLKGARKSNRYRILGTPEPAAEYAPDYAEPTPKPAPPSPKVGRPPMAQEPLLPAQPLSPARSRYVGDLPSEPAPAPPPAATLVADDADVPVDGAPPNSILALGYRACRWPTNAPPIGRGDLTRFCCAETVEGESYCPTHSELATMSAGRTWTPEQLAAAAARARLRAAARSARGAAA